MALHHYVMYVSNRRPTEAFRLLNIYLDFWQTFLCFLMLIVLCLHGQQAALGLV